MESEGRSFFFLVLDVIDCRRAGCGVKWLVSPRAGERGEGPGRQAKAGCGRLLLIYCLVVEEIYSSRGSHPLMFHKKNSAFKLHSSAFITGILHY